MDTRRFFFLVPTHIRRAEVEATFVLLQVYPPEATAEDGSDDCCCLDVIAVNASEAELERFLAGYQFRYAAACRAFAALPPASHA
jgi:hypothetical protein